MKKQLLVIVLFGTLLGVRAQFTVSTELRPRFEYRHGYKTLTADNVDAATFVSQRTRLNAIYKMSYLDFYLSLQDVRVWGDVPQLNKSDRNGIGIHQAWATIRFNKNFLAKLGRQEIVYDDSRFMGNVGWAQQGRSHDALLIKYTRNHFKLDLGLAYNQDKESLFYTDLTTKTYKALQYIWIHKDWSNFSGSILLLNNGLQYINADDTSKNKTRYNQTIGTHLKSKGSLFNVNANLYYQFGKDIANRDLSAYLIGLEGIYTASTKIKLILGGELQSGSNYDTDLNKNNSFTPFYGTNHKFNGWMDYFYVGNHANSVGLLNIYGKANFKISPKGNLGVAIHNFSSAVEIIKGKSKQLGTELDLVYHHKLQKDIKISAGYSHMFAADSMELLKTSGKAKNTNNWGWVMVTINPRLFTTKK